MVSAGAAPDELDAFLKARAGDDPWAPYSYLGTVFLQQSNLFMYSWRKDPAELNPAWSELIDEHREEWQRSPVPELMRLRDYFSFMQFTQQEKVVVFVCGANFAAGQWIGKPGVRCYGGSLPILSRVNAPHEGLLAADPTDPRLAEMLRSYEEPLTYEGYVERLGERGLRVGPAEGGYLVEDATGCRLHEAYKLHGVYDPETWESAWTARNGERLRAALNRQLGAELVLSGPHDDWELRNNRRIAGPLFGPLAPVLAFDTDQYIREHLTPGDLADEYPYLNRWNELYPHHPIPAKKPWLPPP